MLVHQGAIYREAISAEDKQKKREWQFDQKLQEQIEGEQRGWSWMHEIADGLIEEYGDLYPDRLVDPGNLTPEQWEAVHEATTEMVFENYEEEDLKEEAAENLSPEYKHAVDEAHKKMMKADKALDEAFKIYEDDSDEVARADEVLTAAESDLETAREELEEELMYDGTWDELLDSYREEYWEDTVDKLFQTKESIRGFVETRISELLAMEGKPVWRAVIMERGNDPTKYTSLGRHWVNDENLARPFQSQFDAKKWKDPMVVVYEGVVGDPKYLDIKETAEANVWALLVGVPDFGNYTDLNEVRFLAHAPIHVVDVAITDMDPDPGFEGTYDAEEVLPINDWRRA